MEKRYWMGKHLLDRIKSKALPITEVLYSGYELSFIFYNATLHAIYIKDELQATYINKGLESQQFFLRAGCYQSINREVII